MSNDQLSVNTIRVLAADVVQKSASGHPGAPMGCAPMAHLLWTRFMKYNPENPLWFNRDRYVQSNGHCCALLYIMLHLSGYKVSMDDLKQFRQLHSITPGHPEFMETPGVEVSTGPLGQGLTNAVGLAIAQAHLGARFNRAGFPLINNHTWVMCGDGCLQEGVTAEASSLAGHLGLGNLIVLYDDNKITIDGSTDITFTEDVLKRYESYGWHTQTVADGDSNLDELHKAIENAKAETSRPSIIKVRTTIGYGSVRQGHQKTHGAPLGADDIKQLKEKFGFNPEEGFVVPQAVSDLYSQFVPKGKGLEAEWNKMFMAYKEKYPAEGRELQRIIDGKLPDDWDSALPTYTPEDPAKATRNLSQDAINALCGPVTELIGGSADLEGSNLTGMKGKGELQKTSYDGRNVRFGVREMSMAAICNGISAYGGLRPFCATFLVFVSYAFGSMRLSALSGHPVIYVMTHDSIGLGEDGPTHQPIETLALLRATPKMLVIRPACGNEVNGAYRIAMTQSRRPSTLCFTRQGVPHLKGATVEGTLKGAYVLNPEIDNPDVAIIATGSEVSLAVSAAALLTELKVRIVSAPCLEIFDEQSPDYKHSVLPPGTPVVSVEAASVQGWQKYAHASIGIDSFGLSAPGKTLFKHFGFEPDVVAKKVRAVHAHFGGKPAPGLLLDIFAKI